MACGSLRIRMHNCISMTHAAVLAIVSFRRYQRWRSFTKERRDDSRIVALVNGHIPGMHWARENPGVAELT
jgi:hypothetical protein